jgi:hypothetical protein
MQFATLQRLMAAKRPTYLKPRQGNPTMLWNVLVVLLILWALGFGFGAVGNLIHLLLVVALIVLVIQLVSGRRVV